MEAEDTAILRKPVAVPGMAWAAVGVLAFSGTVPATVLALRGMDAFVVGAGRSVLAALLAGSALLATRAPRPRPHQWAGLLLVAAGCGIGFGALSAIALRDVTASHAAVIIGLLPIATAVAARVRGGERATWVFWASSAGGAVVVVTFAASESAGSLHAADLLLLLALAVGAIGYAEGGRLARELPGWQVIAWGLVLALPVSLPLTAATLAHTTIHPGITSLGGLAYVSAVSMFLGFFAWFHGLGEAGIARASQLQLVQPFLTVAWSALLLGERPGITTFVAAALVFGCVAASQQARFSKSEMTRVTAHRVGHNQAA